MRSQGSKKRLYFKERKSIRDHERGGKTTEKHKN
jgi:hypothetical protein